MNYGELLIRGAERSTYRKRPIDTLKQIENIKSKIKADKLAGKDVKIKLNEKLTPTGVAVTEAKRKSGRKAFTEQISLNELQDRLIKIERDGIKQGKTKEKIDEDKEEFYIRYLKIKKMEKDLMLLRDEPEKYLAKLQDLNQLKQDQNIQKELLEQIKSQGLALNQLTQIYSGTLTPAQLIEASPEFRDLTSSEKKVALANLKKQVPRDVAQQKVVIQQILSQPKEVVEKLKQGVKLETQLQESLKPIKAKAEEVEEKPKKKKGTFDVLAVEQDYRKEATAKILIIMQVTKFDSPEQKDYVIDNIDGYLENMSDAQLEKLSNTKIKQFIRQYKEEYDQIKPKATDVLFKEADRDEAEAIVEGENIVRAVDEAENDEVGEQEIHPQLEPLLPAVAENLQELDGINEDEANSDAVDALQGVSADVDEEYQKYETELTHNAINFYLDNHPEIDRNSFSTQILNNPDLAEKLRMDYVISQPSQYDIKDITESEGEKEEQAQTQPTALPESEGKEEAEEEPQATALEPGQEIFSNNGAYNAFTNVPQTGVLSKEQLVKLKLKDLQQVTQDLGLNVKGKRTTKQSHIDAIQKYKSGKGFAPKKLTGKGFVPLHKIPPHVIAGSLAHHIKRVRNKRKLMKVHLHNPFQNTENQEYRKNLTRNAIHDVKGGNIFGSFLAGIATPFRLARNINPAFDFGVGKVADALGVPTISQVISS
jgi:hypothetical protein